MILIKVLEDPYPALVLTFPIGCALFARVIVSLNCKKECNKPCPIVFYILYRAFYIGAKYWEDVLAWNDVFHWTKIGWNY